MLSHFLRPIEHTFYSVISRVMVVMLSMSMAWAPSSGYAQGVHLPALGTMVHSSGQYRPMVIQGVNINPDNPFQLDFIIDQGDAHFDQQAFNAESTKLIKYFLTALTIPENEMWVNLSPYEKNRIIPADFGNTEIGRDLLAQDYILKQFSSSLLHPEQKLGEAYWSHVHAKVRDVYGITEVPINTFNKIWIVPEKAKIYEHAKGAVILDTHLKVMLEEDYLALEANQDSIKHGLGDVKIEDLVEINDDLTAVVREMLIPEVEREVNQGANFSNLRQIYNSVILAAWYKQALKETILGKLYVDQHKTSGLVIKDVEASQKIYERYVEAFKKGVFNIIKEDVDPVTQERIPKKYFSGGIVQTVDNKLDVQGQGNFGGGRSSGSSSLNNDEAQLMTVEQGRHLVQIELKGSDGLEPAAGAQFEGPVLGNVVLQVIHALQGQEEGMTVAQISRDLLSEVPAAKIVAHLRLLIDMGLIAMPPPVGEGEEPRLIISREPLRMDVKKLSEHMKIGILWQTRDPDFKGGFFSVPFKQIPKDTIDQLKEELRVKSVHLHELAYQEYNMVADVGQGRLIQMSETMSDLLEAVEQLEQDTSNFQNELVLSHELFFQRGNKFYLGANDELQHGLLSSSLFFQILNALSEAFRRDNIQFDRVVTTPPQVDRLGRMFRLHLQLIDFAANKPPSERDFKNVPFWEEIRPFVEDMGITEVDYLQWRQFLIDRGSINIEEISLSDYWIYTGKKDRGRPLVRLKGEKRWLPGPLASDEGSPQGPEGKNLVVKPEIADFNQNIDPNTKVEIAQFGAPNWFSYARDELRTAFIGLLLTRFAEEKGLTMGEELNLHVIIVHDRVTPTFERMDDKTAVLFYPDHDWTTEDDQWGYSIEEVYAALRRIGFEETKKFTGEESILQLSGQFDHVIDRMIDLPQLKMDMLSLDAVIQHVRQLSIDDVGIYYADGEEGRGENATAIERNSSVKRLSGSSTLSDTTGGIDLNLTISSMSIQRDNQGLIIPVNPKVLENIHFDGLIPVIINVAPMTNVHPLLGVEL